MNIEKDDSINTVIINQYFGAGDIIFCQSIGNKFVEMGYKVIWPVMNFYAPLAKHFPKVNIIDKALINIDYMRRDEYDFNGVKVIPLRFSDSICGVQYTDCMKSKFMLFDMDWAKWKNFEIVRDHKAEAELFQELGLVDGEKYNLISDQFQTGGTRKADIPEINNGLKNIKMEFKDGFTLIDWSKVIENATIIHAVSSANIYLFEMLENIKAEINLYIRKPNEKNHDNYKYLLNSHNYILQE